MRYRPPELGPGWGPLTTPPIPTPPRANSVLWVRVLAVAVVGGLLLAVWIRAGWVALGLAVALGLLLRRRPDRGRAVAELLAAGTLAVLLAGAPAPQTPKVKAPITVEANQTDQLEPIRKGAINLYAQMAQGFPILPDPPKEGGG